MVLGRNMVAVGFVVLIVFVIVLAVMACGPGSGTPGPEKIQVDAIEPVEVATIAAVTTAVEAGTAANAELVNQLIECYETNVLIWGVTKGGVEARLAEAGHGMDMVPEDMRPFLEDAAVASPDEFRRNGLATLVQCEETR